MGLKAVRHHIIAVGRMRTRASLSRVGAMIIVTTWAGLSPQVVDAEGLLTEVGEKFVSHRESCEGVARQGGIEGKLYGMWLSITVGHQGGGPRGRT